MPFPLFDSIDGAVVNGYVDGLDNEFEQEDFNPPVETEGRCRGTGQVVRHIRKSGLTPKGLNTNGLGLFGRNMA